MPIVPVRSPLETQIEDFLGPWTRLEPTDVPPNRALLAYNTEYNPGNASTRFGFGVYWNVNKAINTLINWIKTPDAVSLKGNYLFVYNSTDSKVQYVPNLLIPVLNDAFTVVAEGISGVSYGAQFVIAAFGLDGIGATQARFVGIYFSEVDVDRAFLGPLTVDPVLSTTGGGLYNTPGMHRVGYLITTRNGYTGKISPVTSDGAFDIASNITTVAGDKIIGSITTTWPAETAFVQIVMSPVNNPFTYYTVPYQTYAAFGTYTVNFSIDISDSDLIATGTEVTGNQDLLTQTPIGTGPFLPFKLISYGGRIVYLTYDGNGHPVFYASDVDAGQQLTEQYHKRALPGFQQITSGFVLRGVLYITGPNWTYSFQDTGDVPVTWPSATLIDGGVGTLSIEGTVVSASGDFAAVAHVTGLYVFTGVYPKLPISYMVDPDWRRINWAVPQKIRVTLNADKKQIIVAAPLDGSTVPNYLLVFDYTNGLGSDEVMYSLWNIGTGGGYPRGLCVWQNPTTQRHETIISSGIAGKILRQMNNTDDANPYQDNGAGVGGTVGSLYEVAPQPRGRAAKMFKHLAAGVRIIGAGTPTITTYNLDRTQSAQWSQGITLQAQPGQEYYRQFDLNAERASTRFTLAGLNNYFILSAYRHIYNLWADRR